MQQTLLLLIILSLSSCSTYQYVTLDSGDMPKNERKELLWENDMMRVAYKFSNEGGFMTIAVFNKTSQPIYVNWKKSALIEDGRAISLFDRTVIVSGAIAADSYQVNQNQSVGLSLFSASFDLPEGIDFLPPLSGLSKTPVNMYQTGSSNSLIPLDVPKERIKIADGTITKFRRIDYTGETSPLKFKIYLTLALGQSSSAEFSVQHSLYAKEVIQTNEAPQSFSMYRKDGSQFFVIRARH
jgi:hypothetical protein